MSKTKILLVTHSTVLPTALAEISRVLFTALLKNYPGQYEVHQIGLFHSQAVVEPAWPISPTEARQANGKPPQLARDDIYGQKTFLKMVNSAQPEIVFACNEAAQLLHLCHVSEQRRHKLVLYLAYDGLPVPAQHGPILNAADAIIAPSEFGRNVALQCQPDIDPSKVDCLYPPADTARFVPPSPEERNELRQNLFPSWISGQAFVLGWVGGQQWRKQTWLLYKVIHHLRKGAYFVCSACGRVSLFEWNPLERRHVEGPEKNGNSQPERSRGKCARCGSEQMRRAEPLNDVFLWLHMPMGGPSIPWPTRQLEQQFDVQPGRDIYYTEGCSHLKALAPADMPILYQLWDGLLYLSGGEAFGGPAWEAMSTAIPVVYTNHSSQGEILGKANAGLPVEGELQPEAHTCVWRMVADVAQAIEAVRKLYFDRNLGRTLGQNGRSFAMQHSADVQAERWHRLFQKVLSGAA